jgi:hypothetical protein
MRIKAEEAISFTAAASRVLREKAVSGETSYIDNEETTIN